MIAVFAVSLLALAAVAVAVGWLVGVAIAHGVSKRTLADYEREVHSALR